ncbi:hypothetical protein EDB89DRAFT_857017 [Lactarius sanguifluus]|nr:hypothetical protein EDB89DRAFT_857017 [Lactarius sanguifluus]
MRPTVSISGLAALAGGNPTPMCSESRRPCTYTTSSAARWPARPLMAGGTTPGVCLEVSHSTVLPGSTFWYPPRSAGHFLYSQPPEANSDCTFATQHLTPPSVTLSARFGSSPSSPGAFRPLSATCFAALHSKTFKHRSSCSTLATGVVLCQRVNPGTSLP